MSIFEQPWFSRIKRPSRYLGKEINAIRKDAAAVDLSVVLAFPDVYEVGMSHLGLKILYHILNRLDWVAAERAFCPWIDMEEELRRRKLPLTTLESQRALSEFDILGFSLQHELASTNVMTMLDLAGIPSLSKEREHPFPLVVAGGPACFNPEPFSSLFDAVVIGDGEEVFVEICRRVREAKVRPEAGKKELLSVLSKIRGVYIPAFFRTAYKRDGTVNTIEPLLQGYREVKKALIPDIDRYPFPTDQVVPYTELVHDRLAIEISRGCTRGCRFCQAGMIYRPVRERMPHSVLRHAQEGLNLTGFGDLSLLSLSSGDYSCLGPLLKALMDKQARDKIALSLPSLRVDTLDPEWFEQIKRVRKTGFTIAPEAGNDRLRARINKTITNEDILRMAGAVYGAGWNLIKLYFMIGLPGETEEDLLDIARLSKEVLRCARGRGKRPNLNVSIAAFVPKAHTPFMWVPQLPLEEAQRRIHVIQDALKNGRMRVKWNQPEMSWLEGIFARGDRRLIRVLMEAWNMGARFDAWSECFDMELWREAFARSGTDPDFYLIRPRTRKEVLPWDHISAGVTKAFLLREWDKALNGQATPDCRQGCLECGVCDHNEIDPVLCNGRGVLPKPPPAPANSRISPKKYRITFSKTGHARHLSHLELMRLFVRAFKRAGLDLVYSEGFHPMPKVAFDAALPVGTESIQETMLLQIFDTMPVERIEERLTRQLPDGVRILALENASLRAGNLKPKESHYRITIHGLHIDQTLLEEFLRADSFPVRKQGKKGEQIIDAKALVKSMALIPPDGLMLVLRHLPGPGLKPMDIVRLVLHLEEDITKGARVLKTRQVMGLEKGNQRDA